MLSDQRVNMELDGEGNDGGVGRRVTIWILLANMTSVGFVVVDWG